MLNIFLKLRRRVMPASWHKQRGRTFAKTTTQVNINDISTVVVGAKVQVMANKKTSYISEGTEW